MPKFKPTSGVLDLANYSNDRPIVFSFAGSSASSKSNDAVSMPISIAYRIFHLGRAYDFQSVKLMYPSGTARLDFAQREHLISELSQVRRLVNDPVVEYYLAQLLPYLEGRRKETGAALFIIEE